MIRTDIRTEQWLEGPSEPVELRDEPGAPPVVSIGDQELGADTLDGILVLPVADEPLALELLRAGYAVRLDHFPAWAGEQRRRKDAADLEDPDAGADGWIWEALRKMFRGGGA
jgi:hypothetical protein